MHSQENRWQAPNGRYGQTPMVEHPRSPPPLSRPQLPAILPQQPPLPRIGARLVELEYTTDNQAQVGGGAPDYEDSYREYGVEEEVLSHFVDFEGDQIPAYVLRGEQRGPSMGYHTNNGLRRSELKCFNCQGPHMVSECPTKHEYYNPMAQRPRHTPLETPPQPPVQGLTQQSQDLIEWFQREASCPGCGKEHLVPDCPEKKKRIGANLLSIVPSTVGANVITRAQRIAHNLKCYDQGLPTTTRKKRKSKKTASTKASKQDQEPEGDVEAILVHPNQELPAHLAAYPNPVAEK